MPRRLRRLGFGLATLLGAAPRGFFIPYRHAGACRPEGYPALAPLFAAAEPRMRAVLDDVAVLSDDLARVPECGPARFDQDWFPRLDAAAAYAVVRRARPRRIVEIGSGHSTRFLAAAVRDGGFTCEITCIDPTPRAGIAALGVRHVPQLLADASPEIFATLEAGDVLFVDSSHVAMPGTDVDRIALDLLPRLPAGVLIHLHDVFLPDPYPPEWAWRGYNEQLLAGALLQGGAYALVFASRYVATRRPEWLDVVADLPLPAGAFETSLWLRKR